MPGHRRFMPGNAATGNPAAALAGREKFPLRAHNFA